MAYGLNFSTCGYGGIGRRARFRFWWETVQVQVLLAAVFFGNLYQQYNDKIFSCAIIVTDLLLGEFPRSDFKRVKFGFFGDVMEPGGRVSFFGQEAW